MANLTRVPPRSQWPTLPPLPDLATQIAQNAQTFGSADPEMLGINNELHAETLRQQELARGAMQHYQMDFNAPLPQLQPPPFSPFQQLGNLVSGNVAAMLLKQPELAQAPMQNMQRMQQMALQTATQQREQNLDMLLKDYEATRAAAQAAGNLEISTKMGEKIQRIQDRRKADLDATQENSKNQVKRGTDQAQLDAEKYKIDLEMWNAEQDRQNRLVVANLSKTAAGGFGAEEALKYKVEAYKGLSKDKKVARIQMKNIWRTMPVWTNFSHFAAMMGLETDMDGKPLWNMNDPKESLEFHKLLVEKDPTGAVNQVATRGLATKEQAKAAYNNGRINLKLTTALLMLEPTPTVAKEVANLPKSRFERAGGAVIGAGRNVGLGLTAGPRYVGDYLFNPEGTTGPFGSYFPPLDSSFVNQAIRRPMGK